MKNFLFAFSLLLSVLQVAFAQTVPQQIEALESRKSACEKMIRSHEDSIRQINKEIAQIEQDIVSAKAHLPVVSTSEQYAAVNKEIGSGVSMKTNRPVNLKANSSSAAYIIAFIPKNANMTILGIEVYPFYKVQYKDKIGYIEAENLEFDGTLDRLNRALGDSVRPSAVQAATYNFTPSTPSKADPVYDTPSTPRSSSDDKTIYTGPRGGRYHYSASGKKVYEKH